VKLNLGKVLFLILLCITALDAEDFVYDMHTNTQTPYLKESVLLSVDINQSNPDVVLFFHFNIANSDAYDVEQIDSSQDYTLHKTKIHYLYVLHPLKSGDINITFNLIKRITNDASVANLSSGDRDDFSKLKTVDKPIPIPSITLHVKPLKKEIQLIGDFKLTYHMKTTKAQAYEPIPMEIILEGEGYPPIIEDIIPQETNITLFTHKPVVSKVTSSQGIKYKVAYSMAISSNENFTLPQIDFKAFNPRENKSYVLSIPPQNFTITPVNYQTLLDKTDRPKPLTNDFSWLQTLLGYTVVFSAGYLTALSWKWKKKHSPKEKHPLIQKIQNCKDEKALLQVLMAADSKNFTSSIEKLEASLYGNGKINLNKVKQDLMEELI